MSYLDIARAALSAVTTHPNEGLTEVLNGAVSAVSAESCPETDVRELMRWLNGEWVWLDENPTDPEFAVREEQLLTRLKDYERDEDARREGEGA